MHMSLRQKVIETSFGVGKIDNGVVGLADGYSCGFSRQEQIVTAADVRNAVNSILLKGTVTPEPEPIKYCTCESDSNHHDYRCNCEACTRRRNTRGW